MESVKKKVAEDVGPDPVWGLGLFVAGMLAMAIGGATTRHILFNVGEGVLLVGVAVFVVCVAITSHKQEHLVSRIRRALRGDDLKSD